MEILQLKYFCDAARTENFSRTAKKFTVPTSDISQSVKRLERELGCLLFDRTANKIILNDDGRKFYHRATEALEMLESARLGVCEHGDALEGEMRIVCLCNRRTVTAAIERFVKIYPEVSLVIRHALDNDAGYDVLVSDVAPAEYGEKLPLIEEDIYVAMSRSDPLATKDDFSVDDLEKRRFITMNSGASQHRITVNACAAAGFGANIAIQTDDPLYLRKYVELGLGVSFVPISSWGGLFHDSVVLRRIAGLRRRTYAFIPRGSHCKRSASEFVRILLEQISKDAED